MKECLAQRGKGYRGNGSFCGYRYRYRTDYSSEGGGSYSREILLRCFRRRVMEEAEWKILPKAIDLIANDRGICTEWKSLLLKMQMKTSCAKGGR